MHSFRRGLLLLIAGVSLAAPAAFGEDKAAPGDAKSNPIFVFIGTYTKTTSKGIYVSKLDRETGAMTPPRLAAEMPNPSFLAISAKSNNYYLYAAGEFGPFNGGSAVGAFYIGCDGMMAKLNTQPAGGGGPCYVVVDKTGKNALVANYGTGSVANLPIGDDGKLSPPNDIDQHHGDDANPKPHAHCIDLDSSNRFALCCDLGLNKVFVYRYDAAAGKLTPNDPPAAQLPAHTGPRHLVFSKNEKFVYTINELASTVTAFTWDAEHGVLHEIQTLSTLPAGFTGENLSAAELAIHPSGKFLYGSNRGQDSIVEYSIDESTGKLTLVGHTPTGGKTPRGFGIDPTGHWLIAGNQNSDTVVEFKIDQKTGELKETGTKFDLGMPVCFKFLEPTP